MMATPRRSGRKRTSTARYSDNVTGIDLGSDGSDDAPAGDPDDDIFEINEANSADDVEPDDVELESGDEMEVISLVGEDNVPTIVVEDDDNASTLLGSKRSKVDQSRKVQRPRRGTKMRMPPGLTGTLRRHVKSDRIRLTYGLNQDDLIPYVKNRDLWGNDATIPSHFAPSAYHSEDMRQTESTEGWKWYIEEGGREAFAHYQQLEALPELEGRRYTSVTDDSQNTFRLGPYKSQRLFSLAVGSSMRLSDAWDIGDGRRGHVFNVGAKIQCLDWLPNNDRDEQCLAISTLQHQSRLRSDQAGQESKATVPSAFTAGPAYPASIQIWRIQGSTKGQKTELIDTKGSAVLEIAICFEWGDVMQFRWCPMPGPLEDQRPRGLIAGIWFDGSVRVLDIDLSSTSSKSPRYLKVTECAFVARMTQSVMPACITWLSTTNFAVGCANGHVAIWALHSHVNSSAAIPSNPQPWFYREIHHSYILSITSAYPSRPYLIFTSSMDGYMRETDLRAPDQDFCLSSRQRFGTVAVAWHDRCQSMLSADEVGVLRANTARRFFQSVEVCRLGSQVADVRASPLHASVLTAQLDGHVYVMNPMRRGTETKGEAWRQTWFEYEWRRGLPEDQVRSVQEMTRPDEGQPRMTAEEQAKHLREPMGRFLDGLRVEQVAGPAIDHQKFTLVNHTVYERGTAITQVAWNPNAKFGGWAAAGMASGLVRIENLELES